MSRSDVQHDHHISHLPNKRDRTGPIGNFIKFTVRPLCRTVMCRNDKKDSFMMAIDIYTFSLITTKIVSSGR